MRTEDQHRAQDGACCVVLASCVVEQARAHNPLLSSRQHQHSRAASDRSVAMVSPKPAAGTAGLILLSGSLVLIFFVILSGVANTSPLNKTYFLEADTSGISGARDVTRWTYFYFCGDNNRDCSNPRAAPAFGRAWDGNAANVPDGLIGGHAGDTTSRFYFYMWRFGWVFYLIALFFIVCAWFSSFLACCGRLGSAIAGLVSAAALFFYTIAVTLMTATFVKARDEFRSADRSANIGTYAFGFSWGAWAALFLATIAFCFGLRGDKTASSGGFGGGRRWGRRRHSTRSRRSHDLGSRRVKDDYS
ncbi:hypothetical protein VDGE_02782 [Verticillium dahliae]|nr:hypothetical protein VDGE_02782 [Verticillium dahliae]